jgi:hypothetical protein
MQSEEPKILKTCKNCQKEFRAWKKTLQFCSSNCETTANNIEDLKVSRFTQKSNCEMQGFQKPIFFGKVTGEQAAFEKKAAIIKIRAFLLDRIIQNRTWEKK